jgi:hypothetical protein
MKDQALAVGSSYRYVKKNVPFSIREIKHPDEIKAWRNHVEARSVVKRAAARETAINAFTTPGLVINNGKIMTEFEAMRTSWGPKSVEKPSVWQRIKSYCMNFFLNINFN